MRAQLCSFAVTLVFFLCVTLPNGAFSAFEDISVWDGASMLRVTVQVTDSTTHQPISGASVTAIRVGKDTLPGPEDPADMPPPQTTERNGHATLRAFFRAAGTPQITCLYVGDSFLRVSAHGYCSREVRLSPIFRLDFAPDTRLFRIAIPVTLTPYAHPTTSNQALELTASRRTTKFSVISTLAPAAERAPARSTSFCSR